MENEGLVIGGGPVGAIWGDSVVQCECPYLCEVDRTTYFYGRMMAKKLHVKVSIDADSGSFSYQHSPDLTAEEIQYLLGQACLDWTNRYILKEDDLERGPQMYHPRFDITPTEDGGFTILPLKPKKRGRQ